MNVPILCPREVVVRVAVCGASGILSGLVHYVALEGQGFDGKSFLAFLRGLHNKMRKPFAILMDNASYHGKEQG